MHRRQRLQGNTDVAADIHDPLARLAGRGRDGDDDLVGPVVAKQVPEVPGRPEHADTVESKVLLARIVVDETDRRIAQIRVLEHFAEDQLAGIARADDEYVAPAGNQPRAAGPLEDRPRGEPGSRDEPDEDQPVDDDDPARKPEGRRVPEVERRHGQDRGDADREERAPDVADRDIAPPVVVQAEDDEGEDLHADHDEHDVQAEERLVAGRHPVVEADVEREDPRQRDETGVDDGLPEAMPVERAHQAAFSAEAARRHSTTCSCSSREMAGQSGSASVSREARSVAGRLPCA